MFCEKPLFIVNKSVTKIRILGINPILYVLKQLFGQTNISLFLLYFFTILDLLTWSSTNTSCYYFFGLLFTKCCSLDFSYHILVVCCWPVYSHWSYQYSLILKLVLRCVRNFSVGSIQTVHTDLFPPQVCGRSWWECWLDVQTCWLQLIYLLDIKYPSSSSLNPYFVGCWLVCIIFIGSAFIDTETFPWVC